MCETAIFIKESTVQRDVHVNTVLHSPCLFTSWYAVSRAQHEHLAIEILIARTSLFIVFSIFGVRA